MVFRSVYARLSHYPGSLNSCPFAARTRESSS